jgi:site-specific recombinase XerD
MSDENSPIFQKWLDKLELSGKATRTLAVYGLEVKKLAAWCAPRDVATLTRDELEQYLLERKRGGMGASGLGVIVCACKSFYHFTGAHEVVAGLKSPPVKGRLQRTLTEAEALAVIASLDSSTVIGKRDLAIIGFLLATGLRASEVCNLRLADVDITARTFSVLVKGGNIEQGVFDEHVAALLESWLAVRPTVARPETDTVFVSIHRAEAKRGHKLTREGIKLLCKRLAQRAGVRHFSPHALRRTFATLATENGCPTRLLQDAGRWKSLVMVETYTRALRLRAFEKYSPLAHLLKGGDN